MKILLSIKPEYSEKIFKGEKKYEYRRRIFKNKKVNKIILYASYPVQKVVGELDIDIILKDDLITLWNKTKRHSGISKDYYFDYFQNMDFGYAIKIKKFKKYKSGISLKESYNLTYVPQSFKYL